MLPLPGVSALVLLGVLGLVFGSFVTALSYRLPRGESVAHGRSKCPACGHVLTARDLVPVFSWLFGRGMCRHCGVSVSWRYPAIEALSALLFVAAGILVRDVPHLVLLLVMTPTMMTLAAIDWETQRLPNSLIAVLGICALTWRWVGDQDFVWGLGAMMAVLVAGAGITAIFKTLTGRPGIGMGDTKLFAVLVLAFAPGPALLFLTFAGVFGVLFGLFWRLMGYGPQFPFGPAILASAWVCLAAGDQVFQAFVTLLSG